MRKHPFLLKTATRLVVLFFLFITGCKKSDSGGNTPGGNGPTVITNIRGIVVDENNAAVSGATVKAGNFTTSTDATGVFNFKNVEVDNANGYVRVEKTGFLVSGKSFLPSSGRTQEVRLMLNSFTFARNYNIISPTSIGATNGEKLTWTGSALQTQAGAAYTGVASPVFVAYTGADYKSLTMMAGDARGIDINGNEKVIFPYNIVSALLNSNSGQALKLAAGSTVSVETPIQGFMQAGAPSTIPLWVFNDTTGRWIQQGTATRTADKYVFTINRFGHWACAVPYDGIRLTGSIKSQLSSDAITSTVFKVAFPNTVNFIGGVTDSSGYFDLMVPVNKALRLLIYDHCSYDMVGWNVGPYANNSSAGTLTTNGIPSSIYNYKATVKNCSGGLVTNGTVFFFAGSYEYYSVPIVNGQCSFSTLACTPYSIRYYAIDYTTGLKSPVTSFSPPGTVGGVFNLPDINTCATYTGEFVNMTIEGNNYSFVNPTDSITSGTSNSTGAPGYTKSTFIRLKSYAPGSIYGNYQINSFAFYHNGTTGTVPVYASGSIPVTIYLTPPLYFTQTFVPNSFPQLTITNFGPVGTGYIEGNFTWQIQDGTNKTLTGSFKVKNN